MYQARLAGTLCFHFDEFKMPSDCGCDSFHRLVLNILSTILLMCLPILQGLESLPDSLPLGPRIYLGSANEMDFRRANHTSAVCWQAQWWRDWAFL